MIEKITAEALFSGIDVIHVDEGSKGLDLAFDTYQGVIMGFIPFQQKDFNNKEEISDGIMILVQFPTEISEETKKPKMAWTLCSNYISEKANFIKMLSGIYGEKVNRSHALFYQDGPNKGHVNPSIIRGKNCLVSIGDTSKKEGEKRAGITGFSKLMKGMKEYPCDYTVEIPEIIVKIKDGMLLKEKSDSPAQEAPTMPNTGKKASSEPNSPSVPTPPQQEHKTETAATNNTAPDTAANTAAPSTGKRGRPAKTEQAQEQPKTETPAAQTVTAPTQTATNAAPQKYKSQYVIKDGVQQHCSICGKPQFTRDPAKGGGHTCEEKHLNAESKESLLDFDDKPGDDEDLPPDAAGNVC